MDGFLGHALSVFMGFFAIMNPIANTPVFLGLTAGDDAGTRRKVAARALIASFIIIVVFCAAGKLIFDLFGITLPAFRITGGVLVAIVGFHMLQGGEHPVSNTPVVRISRRVWAPSWRWPSHHSPCRYSPDLGPLPRP